MLQRVIAKRTGIPQQNISAYERGHVQPSWAMFVRMLAAMGRRPVISIESRYREDDLQVTFGPPERRLELALTEALAVIGDREYRVEDDVATHLHGGSAPIREVLVSVVGEPELLDRLAVRAAARELTVVTERVPRHRPVVRFTRYGVTVLLIVVDVPRRHVWIALGEQRLAVAPIGGTDAET